MNMNNVRVLIHFMRKKWRYQQQQQKPLKKAHERTNTKKKLKTIRGMIYYSQHSENEPETNFSLFILPNRMNGFWKQRY